jgi:prefoldin subunit 5
MAITPTANPAAEKQWLTSQMTLLEAELERIRQRLEALEKTADIIKKD